MSRLLIAALAGVLPLSPFTSAESALATARRPAATRLSSAAVLKALDGDMPRAFDLDVHDPCFGPWTASLPNGWGELQLMVIRNKGVPIVHVANPAKAENHLWTRLSPQSIRFKSGNVTSVMTCSQGQATMVGTMIVDGASETFDVPVRRGPFPLP